MRKVSRSKIFVIVILVFILSSAYFVFSYFDRLNKNPDFVFEKFLKENLKEKYWPEKIKMVKGLTLEGKIVEDSYPFFGMEWEKEGRRLYGYIMFYGGYALKDILIILPRSFVFEDRESVNVILNEFLKFSEDFYFECENKSYGPITCKYFNKRTKKGIEINCYQREESKICDVIVIYSPCRFCYGEEHEDWCCRL
ncbi:MAG: hypothetical protein QXD89_01420 [Candidatus Aenigmatarchaeota archaeon]